mmetsp:Transcript_12924/g.25891  ORF Transcript_12924/g.25891 Transcript_12924/m.25891 type:complete len:95 (+) Transcript_12924:1282-1566(+)
MKQPIRIESGYAMYILLLTFYFLLCCFSIHSCIAAMHSLFSRLNLCTSLFYFVMMLILELFFLDTEIIPDRYRWCPRAKRDLKFILTGTYHHQL